MAIIFSVLVIFVVGLGLYRMISEKETPDNTYTPYDHITGQSSQEFNENKRNVE